MHLYNSLYNLGLIKLFLILLYSLVYRKQGVSLANEMCKLFIHLLMCVCLNLAHPSLCKLVSVYSTHVCDWQNSIKCTLSYYCRAKFSI